MNTVYKSLHFSELEEVVIWLNNHNKTVEVVETFSTPKGIYLLYYEEEREEV